MNRLRQLREEKGYSLRELGLKVDMNASVLGNYEREDRQPRIDVWEKLADFFNVTPGYIMGISPIREQSNLFEIDKDSLPLQSKIILDEINDFVSEMLGSGNGWSATQAKELFSNINQILNMSQQSNTGEVPLGILVFFSSLIKDITVGSFYTDSKGNELSQSEITTKYLTSREQLSQKLDGFFSDQINRREKGQ